MAVVACAIARAHMDERRGLDAPGRPFFFGRVQRHPMTGVGRVALRFGRSIAVRRHAPPPCIGCSQRPSVWTTRASFSVF